MILAIDTATDQASLAVLAESGLAAELTWFSRGNHSLQLGRLLPAILEIASAPVTALTGIAVAAGPGSFSGVRVGISLAKGLALARGLPMAGISTLDIIAYSVAREDRTVCALLPAGRGEIYLACYEGAGTTWRRFSEYTRQSVDAAAEQYRDGTLLAGEGAGLLGEAIAARGGIPELARASDGVRRAGYLAELGRQYFDAHGRDRLEELQPLYLRRSSAEEKRAVERGE